MNLYLKRIVNVFATLRKVKVKHLLNMLVTRKYYLTDGVLLERW